MEAPSSVIKFAPFASTAEASFWIKLAEYKLNVLRLSEEAVNVSSTYGTPQKMNKQAQDDQEEQQQGSFSFQASPRMRWDHTSLQIPNPGEGENEKGMETRNELVECKGIIKILNTVEEFKRLDKTKLVKDMIYPKLMEEAIEKDAVELLNTFCCVAYLDLKKHTVLYWFLFPALSPPTSPFTNTQMDTLRASYGPQLCHNLARAVLDMRLQHPSCQCPPFFIITGIPDSHSNPDNTNSDNTIKCLPLSSTSFDALSDDHKQTAVFAFLDPSAMPQNPGWPMRNLLAYLALKIYSSTTNPPQTIRVLAYRPGIMRRITTQIKEKLLQDSVDTDMDDAILASSQDESLLITLPFPSNLSQSQETPKWNVVGWELNARSKPGPRLVNLSTVFDPTHLASQSVDLNLKLMKWRLLPNLDTDKLAHNTKCLLLGAGTLGCNVARTLLGWGVRHITLVDNGRVSYSNPVRQSLFENADCLDGGKYKAQAAADALKRIFPGVESKGIVLSIPMPGHAMGTSDQALQDAKDTVHQLDALIQAHDVTFLLTDTRESRWLPTLMAVAHNKMLINAALGLDSWLVMRHGHGHITDGAPSSKPIPPPLGCYFCNDVVAPSDSMKERTMDQQCTVTRPGLAPIASAMAVELMVALRHLPLEHLTQPTDESVSQHSDLGQVPHQIRGFLSPYQLITPTTPRFDCCTACSPKVVQQFNTNGFDFVKKVTDDAQGGAFLEELTGLAALKMGADESAAAWDEDDGELSQDADDW